MDLKKIDVPVSLIAARTDRDPFFYELVETTATSDTFVREHFRCNACTLRR